jgi:hypothetical protein
LLSTRASSTNTPPIPNAIGASVVPEHQCRSVQVCGAQLDALVGGGSDADRFLVAAAVGDLDHARATQCRKRRLDGRVVVRDAQQLRRRLRGLERRGAVVIRRRPYRR